MMAGALCLQPHKEAEPGALTQFGSGSCKRLPVQKAGDLYKPNSLEARRFCSGCSVP